MLRSRAALILCLAWASVASAGELPIHDAARKGIRSDRDALVRFSLLRERVAERGAVFGE